MTYVSKFRPAGGRVVAVYTCPEHGEFDADVERDSRGEAPDMVACPVDVDEREDEDGELRAGAFGCGQPATWTPSPITCRVRRIEAVKGGWERPERPTYLDTRKLGEGQSMDEFRAERKAVWERKRQAEVMALKKGF